MTTLVTNFTMITLLTKVHGLPMIAMVNSVVKVFTNSMVTLIVSVARSSLLLCLREHTRSIPFRGHVLSCFYFHHTLRSLFR